VAGLLRRRQPRRRRRRRRLVWAAAPAGPTTGRHPVGQTRPSKALRAGPTAKEQQN
jgi:hypothetical protein